MQSKIDKQKKMGLFLIAFFLLFFLIDGINTIKYGLIAYDDAYNATVAANMVRIGKYVVTYPSEIIFHNIITTGPLVLLPTAIIYKLFGISSLTTGIVPLLYSVVDILLIFIIICKCTKNTKYNYILAAIGTSLLCMGDTIFTYISTHLLGESASLCFVLLTTFFLLNWKEKSKNKDLFLAGGFLAASFLTKSSMIFIVVSFLGLMIIEWLTKKMTFKQFLTFILGFLFFFGILEIFKLLQLGGPRRYLQYWDREWANMLKQSSGIDTSVQMSTKFWFFKDIFSSFAILGVFLTLLPVLLYACNFIRRILNKKEIFSTETNCLLFTGVASASLLVFFLLLGGNGLMYARRLIVNSFLLKIVGFILMTRYLTYLKQKKKSKKTMMIGTIFLLLLMMASPKLIENGGDLLQKESEDTYEKQLMNNLIEDIKEYDKQGIVYVADWWQEPNITLFLPDYKMYNVYEKEFQNDDSEIRYFVVGSVMDQLEIKDIEDATNTKLERVSQTQIDYTQDIEQFDRKDLDLYSLYKMTRVKKDASS